MKDKGYPTLYFCGGGEGELGALWETYIHTYIHTYMFYLFGVLYNKGYINQYMGYAQVDNRFAPSLALKQNIEATSMMA